MAAASSATWAASSCGTQGRRGRAAASAARMLSSPATSCGGPAGPRPSACTWATVAPPSEQHQGQHRPAERGARRTAGTRARVVVADGGPRLGGAGDRETEREQADENHRQQVPEPCVDDVEGGPRRPRGGDRQHQTQAADDEAGQPDADEGQDHQHHGHDAGEQRHPRRPEPGLAAAGPGGGGAAGGRRGTAGDVVVEPVEDGGGEEEPEQQAGGQEQRAAGGVPAQRVPGGQREPRPLPRRGRLLDGRRRRPSVGGRRVPVVRVGVPARLVGAARAASWSGVRGSLVLIPSRGRGGGRGPGRTSPRR